MISDLSPGDKLSLKGKIFELQKRLNILDIESKRNNEISTMFKPTIYTYSLPARERCICTIICIINELSVVYFHISYIFFSISPTSTKRRNVLDSINKAEIIKKVICKVVIVH